LLTILAAIIRGIGVSPFDWLSAKNNAAFHLERPWTCWNQFWSDPKADRGTHRIHV